MVDVNNQKQKLAKVIHDHYARVTRLLIDTFGIIPIIGVTYPNGFHKEAKYVEFAPKRIAGELSAVKLHTRTGLHRYVGLADASIEWLQRHHHVIELHSWAPRSDNSAKAAFGRILVEPHGNAGATQTRDACRIVASMLAKRSLQSAVCLSGGAGAQLWIPFDDGPSYPELRGWLHALVREAVETYPAILSDLPRAERGDRVFLGVSVNAVGRFAALPYSLRGSENLPMVTPISWRELDTVENGAINMSNAADRLDAAGDIFALEVARIGRQRFTAQQCYAVNNMQPIAPGCAEHRPHAYLINAILTLLADGQPRSAAQILTEGQRNGLIPSDVTSRYVDHSIISYIGRLGLRGRKALIVQDSDRRFRLNHPLNDWPVEPVSAGEASATPAPNSLITELIERLRTTATGLDATAFEQAVCDAVAALGFIATHVGGNHEPDGYADAPLGKLGYRMMIECKTAKEGGIVNDPSVYEAARYREPYGASYCMLIGPTFGESTALDVELRTHGVSLWTVEDLVSVFGARLDPFVLQKALQPGRAADALWDLLWDRIHGEGNRVRVVCRYVYEEGWRAQEMAASEVPPPESPVLNVDAAMMLVDERLDREGHAIGCTRRDVEAAFAWLTHPRIARATTLEDPTSIVIINHRELGSKSISS